MQVYSGISYDNNRTEDTEQSHLRWRKKGTLSSTSFMIIFFSFASKYICNNSLWCIIFAYNINLAICEVKALYMIVTDESHLKWSSVHCLLAVYKQDDQ